MTAVVVVKEDSLVAGNYISTATFTMTRGCPELHLIISDAMYTCG